MSGTVTQIKRYVGDTLQNLVSMLGTDRDKAYHNQFTLNLLTRDQLEAAYRSDWVSRKIVDIPAKDATRAGRNWQADENQIELLEAEEKRLHLMLRLKTGLIKSRLYGGGALVLGFGDDASRPLLLESVKKGSLKYVHALASHELREGDAVLDVNDPDFGTPEFYTLAASKTTTEVRIHRSRVVRLVGAPYPDRNVMHAGGDGWGDSVLQAAYDAVMNVAGSTSAIAYLIQELKLDVVKIPDFMKNMNSPTYKAEITDRFALANQTKSLTSTLIMDREEEWERVNASFAGLPEVMKLYLLIASGAADIPATRLLGQSAVGLNATGDGDLRNYYDHISSVQATELTPALTTLDEVLIRSALGTRPPEVWYEWVKLWQLTEKEEAEIAKSKADTTKVYVDAAVIDPEILEKVVYNQLVEDGTYPGIEQAKDEYEAAGGGVDEEDDQVQEQFEESRAEAKPKLKVVGGKDTPAGDALRKLAKIVMDEVNGKKPVADAEPRTLYVRRDLLNADAVRAHYAAQLGEVDAAKLYPAEQMHVTLIYSKQPVDWIKIGENYPMGDENGTLVVSPGGPRFHEMFGPLENKDTMVLQFASSRLAWRHEDMKCAGCSTSYDEYQPHVSLMKNPSDVELLLSELKPWTGELRFGPEIFEEVDEDWTATKGVDDSLPFLGDDFDEDKVDRDESGKFSSGGGGGGSKPDKGSQFVGMSAAQISSFSVKGNSGERIAMRAALKSMPKGANYNPERQALQGKIIESFKKDYDKAVQKGNSSKASDLAAKTAAYSQKYGVKDPITSGMTKEAANLGYSQKEVATAKEVAASAGITGAAYSPQETKAFNDLVAISGSSQAKAMALHAKERINNNAALKASGITPGEAAHIVAYTGHQYKEVNKALRDGVLTESQWGHVAQLNQALEKLPDYRGTVFRKTNVDPSKYPVGSIVEERHFTSSAKDTGIWSGSVRYEIMSKTGKDIEKLSIHGSSEKEVLFRNGTRFRVTGKSGNTIKMEEVGYAQIKYAE